MFVFTISVQSNPDWKVRLTDRIIQVLTCKEKRQISEPFIFAVLLRFRPCLWLWYKCVDMTVAASQFITDEEKKFATWSAIKPVKWSMNSCLCYNRTTAVFSFLNLIQITKSLSLLLTTFQIKSYFVFLSAVPSGGWESSMHCILRKRMQINKAQANTIWQHMQNFKNTMTKERTNLTNKTFGIKTKEHASK